MKVTELSVVYTECSERNAIHGECMYFCKPLLLFLFQKTISTTVVFTVQEIIFIVESYINNRSYKITKGGISTEICRGKYSMGFFTPYISCHVQTSCTNFLMMTISGKNRYILIWALCKAGAILDQYERKLNWPKFSWEKLNGIDTVCCFWDET
jgi:hypothetical protein